MSVMSHSRIEVAIHVCGITISLTDEYEWVVLHIIVGGDMTPVYKILII
jgi:hypothetical protein